MLERLNHLRYAGGALREEVTPDRGESKESRFQAWIAENSAKPRFCERHPRTPLVLDRHDQGIAQAYADQRFGPLIERPGVFIFRAALRCPACRCTYALCPPEFCTTTFETFDTTTAERANALARCREFAAQVNKHGGGFAQLVGRPGTGKTRLACNIIGALENSDALYIRQGQLTSALRASYGRKSVEYDDEGERIEPENPLEITQSVRCLVLDEIGCTALANDERLLLDELLKHRYERRKPTILISNLALDQLKEFLGDALADRIRHATGNGKFILQFSGESFRRTSGENYLEGLR